VILYIELDNFWCEIKAWTTKHVKPVNKRL